MPVLEVHHKIINRVIRLKKARWVVVFADGEVMETASRCKINDVLDSPEFLNVPVTLWLDGLGHVINVVRE